MTIRIVIPLGVVTMFFVVWQTLGNRKPTDHTAEPPEVAELPESESNNAQLPRDTQGIVDITVRSQREISIGDDPLPKFAAPSVEEWGNYIRNLLRDEETLELTFHSEQRDLAWAPRAEAGIYDVLTGMGNFRAARIDVECRSTLCRLLIVSPSLRDFRELQERRQSVEFVAAAGVDSIRTEMDVGPEGNWIRLWLVSCEPFLVKDILSGQGTCRL